MSFSDEDYPTGVASTTCVALDDRAELSHKVLPVSKLLKVAASC